MTDLGRLIWAPCPGRQAPPLAAEPSGQPAGGGADSWLGPAGLGAGLGGRRSGSPPPCSSPRSPRLMARPFGWLVVAEPTDQLDIETAELRSQLNVVRRFDEERSRFDADRMARRLAELDAFREAGLWNVRVLVGAADVEQLNVIAPDAGRCGRPHEPPVPASRPGPGHGPGRRTGGHRQLPGRRSIGAVLRDGRSAGRASRAAPPRGPRDAGPRRRLLRRHRRTARRRLDHPGHDPGRQGPRRRRVRSAARHPQPARADHRGHRLRQVPDRHGTCSTSSPGPRSRGW